MTESPNIFLVFCSAQRIIVLFSFAEVVLYLMTIAQKVNFICSSAVAQNVTKDLIRQKGSKSLYLIKIYKIGN